MITWPDPDTPSDVERTLAAMRPDPLPLPPERTRAIFEAALATVPATRRAALLQWWRSFGLAGAVSLIVGGVLVLYLLGKVRPYRTVQSAVEQAAHHALTGNIPAGAITLEEGQTAHIVKPVVSPLTAETRVRRRGSQRAGVRAIVVRSRAFVRKTGKIARLRMVRPVLTDTWSATKVAETVINRAPLPTQAELEARDVPRLLVVAQHVEPSFSITVHSVPPLAGGGGYARVSVLRRGGTGEAAWFQSTIHDGGEPSLVLIGQAADPEEAQ